MSLMWCPLLLKCLTRGKEKLFMVMGGKQEKMISVRPLQCLSHRKGKGYINTLVIIHLICTAGISNSHTPVTVCWSFSVVSLHWDKSIRRMKFPQQKRWFTEGERTWKIHFLSHHDFISVTFDLWTERAGFCGPAENKTVEEKKTTGATNYSVTLHLTFVRNCNVMLWCHVSSPLSLHSLCLMMSSASHSFIWFSPWDVQNKFRNTERFQTDSTFIDSLRIKYTERLFPHLLETHGWDWDACKRITFPTIPLWRWQTDGRAHTRPQWDSAHGD